MTLHELDSMCSPSVWRWRFRDDPSRVRLYVFSLSMAAEVLVGMVQLEDSNNINVLTYIIHYGYYSDNISQYVSHFNN